MRTEDLTAVVMIARFPSDHVSAIDGDHDQDVLVRLVANSELVPSSLLPSHVELAFMLGPRQGFAPRVFHSNFYFAHLLLLSLPFAGTSCFATRMTEGDVGERPELGRIFLPVLDVNDGKVFGILDLQATSTAHVFAELLGELVDDRFAEMFLRRTHGHT